MTTTKERIDADIKKNVMSTIKETVSEKSYLIESIQDQIAEQAGEVSRKLTDLVTPGSKAFDAELSYAIDRIQKNMVKEMVETIKRVYKIR